MYMWHLLSCIVSIGLWFFYSYLSKHLCTLYLFPSAVLDICGSSYRIMYCLLSIRTNVWLVQSRTETWTGSNSICNVLWHEIFALFWSSSWMWACVYIYVVVRTNSCKNVVLQGCGKLRGSISYFLATGSSQVNVEVANDVDPKYSVNPCSIVSIQV